MPKLKPRTPETGFREPTSREGLKLILCGYSPYSETAQVDGRDSFSTWEEAWRNWRETRSKRMAAAARHGCVPAAEQVWGDR
jgi:hypothetical protein